MAISYDPTSKKWNVEDMYEKTDYKVDNPTDAPTDLRTNYPTTQSEPKEERYTVQVPYITSSQERYTAYRWVNKTDSNGRTYSVKEPYTDYRMVSKTEYRTEWRTRTVYETVTNYANIDLNAKNEKTNYDNTQLNSLYSKLNSDNTALNQQNTYKNQAYDNTVTAASTTEGGDYVKKRDTIRKSEGIDDRTKKTLEDYYKAFYTTEKLPAWDLNLGAKPPYGDFDASYYKTQSSTAAQQWASAVANDDIDLTQRYGGESGFYLHHYTTQGKPAGLRGNKAEVTAAANQYVEETPTDVDIQAARTLQLGVDTDTQTERLLNIPTVASEWEKAKKDDPYWKEQAKEKFLDVNKPDEFAALFRLSDRPEDQIVRLNYNANAGYGITELEDAIGEAVGEKATVDVKRFGALTQDVLKQTINEMKKAKVREQEISIFKGLGPFNEIMDINKELSNSILGDSGVGGILSFTEGGKAQESLEKSLTGITGVNTNNTVYNWQKWFDETLKTKYDENLELGYTTEEAKEQVKIEADFAKEFVDKYLIPRFDQSKSMDEFVEYLDVRQSEQNPFQTQDIMNAAKLVADTRAKSYLDQLKATPGRYFDSNFYFSPTGDKAREGAYADQASTVATDW